MEETLGKRIVSNRKRLGLTQDALAERLGVTAQAVSKWENDQSCPDISILPRLAEIFGISIDALLGCGQPQKERIYEAEVISEPEEKDELKNDGLRYQNGKWEFRYDGGRKIHLGFALWVLLVGGLLLASNFYPIHFTLWELLWPSALLIFGLFGLYPKFSMFRFGCTFFGGYFLLENIGLLHLNLGMNLFFPLCLLLLGLSLLVDALRKPNGNKFFVSHNGKNYSFTDRKKHLSSCQLDEEAFECSTSFGSDTHRVDLSRLHHGQADVSFGELTVDLNGVDEIAENCRIDAGCSFGELRILVPRRYRVEYNSDTAFASIDVQGHPNAEPQGIITMDAAVSFGQITIQYI